MNDELDALSGVEAPNDWIGGLLTVAALLFAYWITN
jgi:hypothetical protein